MAPKFKFTKDEMISAALNVTRKKGMSGLTARALAAELGCSVKPIFGMFQNMEELQQEVLTAVNHFYKVYLQESMSNSPYPPYKACGMAYISFAKEEKEFFKLLFMRNRSYETIEDSIKKIDNYKQQFIMKNGLIIDIQEIIDLNSDIFKNIRFE